MTVRLAALALAALAAAALVAPVASFAGTMAGSPDPVSSTTTPALGDTP